MILRLVLLLLATFWAWETLRFVAVEYTSRAFSLTRALHPLIVAAMPLYVLWPDWVTALGVAGATGLLVTVVDRWLVAPAPTPIPLPRRRTPGSLPPLP